jgi:hypothetical protein
LVLFHVNVPTPCTAVHAVLAAAEKIVSEARNVTTLFNASAPVSLGVTTSAMLAGVAPAFSVSGVADPHVTVPSAKAVCPTLPVIATASSVDSPLHVTTVPASYRTNVRKLPVHTMVVRRSFGMVAPKVKTILLYTVSLAVADTTVDVTAELIKDALCEAVHVTALVDAAAQTPALAVSVMVFAEEYAVAGVTKNVIVVAPADPIVTTSGVADVHPIEVPVV